MRVLKLIDKAQRYAYAQHSVAGQLYDGQPYSVHLNQVAEIAIYHDDLLNSDEESSIALAGAYLHDIIEDCRVTFNDVQAATSAEAAEIAYLLATPKGRNRAARHCDAYYQEMATNKLAAYVKICDRLANVGHSIEKGGGRMLDLYRKEQAHFSKWLRPAWPQFEPMWLRLESLLSTLVSSAPAVPEGA